jgi:hypothetical protein
MNSNYPSFLPRLPNHLVYIGQGPLKFHQNGHLVTVSHNTPARVSGLYRTWGDAGGWLDQASGCVNQWYAAVKGSPAHEKFAHLCEPPQEPGLSPVTDHEF